MDLGGNRELEEAEESMRLSEYISTKRHLTGSGFQSLRTPRRAMPIAWQMVEVELRKDPTATSKELALRLGWSKNQASNVLGRMKKKGIIQLVHQWEIVSK
jgi:hypothetical protein